MAWDPCPRRRGSDSPEAEAGPRLGGPTGTFLLHMEGSWLAAKCPVVPREYCPAPQQVCRASSTEKRQEWRRGIQQQEEKQGWHPSRAGQHRPWRLKEMRGLLAGGMNGQDQPSCESPWALGRWTKRIQNSHSARDCGPGNTVAATLSLGGTRKRSGAEGVRETQQWMPFKLNGVK